jgi:ATP-dependent exoDNAse (exonuclease V) beta subunit
MIHRSQDGSPSSAAIYDFKTDHGTDAEISERYSGQMETYRRAVSHLLGLDERSVDCKILRVR